MKIQIGDVYIRIETDLKTNWRVIIIAPEKDNEWMRQWECKVRADKYPRVDFTTFDYRRDDKDAAKSAFEGRT